MGYRTHPPCAPQLLPAGFPPLWGCVPCAGTPVSACTRFRSAKNAAVLRLQRTQSKDRRFYKAFAGYTAPQGRKSGRQKLRSTGRVCTITHREQAK